MANIFWFQLPVWEDLLKQEVLLLYEINDTEQLNLNNAEKLFPDNFLDWSIKGRKTENGQPLLIVFKMNWLFQLLLT